MLHYFSKLIRNFSYIIRILCVQVKEREGFCFHACVRVYAAPPYRSGARSALGRRTEIEFRNRSNIFVVSHLRHLSPTLYFPLSFSLFLPACHRRHRRRSRSRRNRRRRGRRLVRRFTSSTPVAERNPRRASSPILRLPHGLSGFRHRTVRIHLSTAYRRIEASNLSLSEEATWLGRAKCLIQVFPLRFLFLLFSFL